VARDLGVTSKRLVEDLCNQGIDVTSNFSLLDEETVELVLNLYREQDAAAVPAPPPIEQTVTVTPLEATQSHVTLVTEGEEDAAKDRISGGIMSLAEESNNTAADLPDRRSETSDADAEESGESTPSDTRAEETDTSVPMGTRAEESSESTPSDTRAEESSESTPSDMGVEEGRQFVVVDLGQARRRQVKRLRRGRGSLMRRVSRLFVELQAEGAFSPDASTLIIVIEAGRQRRG